MAEATVAQSEEQEPETLYTQVADIDWIPATKHWYNGRWLENPTYATFKTSNKWIRLRVEIVPEGYLVKYKCTPKMPKQEWSKRPKNFITDRFGLAVELRVWRAVQNPRKKGLPDAGQSRA